MKRIITFVMMLGLLAGITACNEDRGHGTDHRRDRDSGSSRTEIKVDVDELKTHDGPMLEITSTIQAPVPDDVERVSSIILHYDGTISNPGYPNQCLGLITDEDYSTVYSFCVETVRDNTFADYYEEVCDGQTYRFVFYDEEGESHELYDGYIYDNAELSSVVDLFYAY